MSGYTLADLLGHWERGELTLDEVLAGWSHADKPAEELLRELLQMIMVQHCHLRRIERRVAALTSR